MLKRGSAVLHAVRGPMPANIWMSSSSSIQVGT
jgi:hypothetical protein